MSGCMFIVQSKPLTPKNWNEHIVVFSGCLRFSARMTSHGHGQRLPLAKSEVHCLNYCCCHVVSWSGTYKHICHNTTRYDAEQDNNTVTIEQHCWVISRHRLSRNFIKFRSCENGLHPLKQGLIWKQMATQSPNHLLAYSIYTFIHAISSPWPMVAVGRIKDALSLCQFESNLENLKKKSWQPTKVTP